MMNSHDTYADRKMLFDHMNSVLEKRGDKSIKRAVTKKLTLATESKKLNEAYDFYSDQLSNAHKRMQEQPELSNPDKHVNYIDEMSLILEDEVYVKYGIKYNELRAIVKCKDEESQSSAAQTPNPTQ